MPGGDYQEEMEMNNNTEMQFQENSEPPHHEPGHATGDMGSSHHQADEEPDHTANGQSTHDMQGHDSMAEHHENMQHADHAGHEGHGAHIDHTGHEKMFRRKFWISLLLSIPVLVFSPSIQHSRIFWQPMDYPGFCSDCVPLRWHTILTDGPSRAKESSTRHDDTYLSCHQCSLYIQCGSLIPAQ